ncbi:hypothetical protein BWI17_03615 [Betaproteobacteria bacterium GR16-43]|nr:hypothetical protein BWI17_03615 [Betaproteobacteria bacterium GR16-43]
MPLGTTGRIGIGMLVASVAVAIPVVLSLPESWLGGVIVLALAGNGIVLLLNRENRTWQNNKSP